MGDFPARPSCCSPMEPSSTAKASARLADGRRGGVQHLDVGYQEILTDPSYCRQIVTPTYPHIGNTGINPRTEPASGRPVWSSATCPSCRPTSGA